MVAVDAALLLHAASVIATTARVPTPNARVNLFISISPHRRKMSVKRWPLFRRPPAHRGSDPSSQSRWANGRRRLVVVKVLCEVGYCRNGSDSGCNCGTNRYFTSVRRSGPVRRWERPVDFGMPSGRLLLAVCCRRRNDRGSRLTSPGRACPASIHLPTTVVRPHSCCCRGLLRFSPLVSGRAGPGFGNDTSNEAVSLRSRFF